MGKIKRVKPPLVGRNAWMPDKAIRETFDYVDGLLGIGPKAPFPDYEEEEPKKTETDAIKAFMQTDEQELAALISEFKGEDTEESKRILHYAADVKTVKGFSFLIYELAANEEFDLLVHTFKMCVRCESEFVNQLKARVFKNMQHTCVMGMIGQGYAAGRIEAETAAAEEK